MSHTHSIKIYVNLNEIKQKKINIQLTDSMNVGVLTRFNLVK